ncbi:MAG: MAC/perforin domain-containing protein, partial [Bacteroidota bacterium]
MKRNIHISSLIAFLMFAQVQLWAQHQFQLAAETASALTGVDYLPQYQTAVFFQEGNGFYYPYSTQQSFHPEWFSLTPAGITASLPWTAETMLLFSGSSYLSYNFSTGEMSSEWEMWPGLPANWNQKLDAAIRWNESWIFFIHNFDYVVYDISQQAYIDEGSISQWNGFPEGWEFAIDGAVNMLDGFIYFFSNGNVLPYSQEQDRFFSPALIGNAEMGFPPQNQPNNPSAPVEQEAPQIGQSNPPAAQDEYIDTYQDHTATLENQTVWYAQPLPGLDWLGAGFDILRYDPLKPNNLKNRKRFRSVIMTTSPERAGNSAQYLKPYGTFFGSESSGEVSDSSAWITSYESFQKSFNVGAGGSVSVPGAAAGSLSGSHTEMNATSVGSESIYMINKNIRRIHEAVIRPTWKDVDRGQNYRQKLDPLFRDDVARLPLPRMKPEELSDLHITKKGQRLPAALYSVKNQYDMFMRKYGTHYASRVTWGGQYISCTQIRRSDYERSRMSASEFQAAASAVIKGATVGGSVSFGTGEGTANGTSTTNFVREVYVQGGNGEDDLNKWRDKVDASPGPVELGFTAMCDLLTKAFFPTDEEIEMKRQILRLITEFYLVNSYRRPTASKGDFFRELPALPMPSNISITNKGGYVMWFKVKYEYEGKWVEETTDSYSLGYTKTKEIPAGARNLTITASHTFGEIFSETFAQPQTLCFNCWGTVFEAV